MTNSFLSSVYHTKACHHPLAETLCFSSGWGRRWWERKQWAARCIIPI